MLLALSLPLELVAFRHPELEAALRISGPPHVVLRLPLRFDLHSAIEGEVLIPMVTAVVVHADQRHIAVNVPCEVVGLQDLEVPLRLRRYLLGRRLPLLVLGNDQRRESSLGLLGLGNAA